MTNACFKVNFLEYFLPKLLSISGEQDLRKCRWSDYIDLRALVHLCFEIAT